ncbi:MAG: zinc ribbon domain-containing protein [Verrucomicrobiae bacterium]|nr:zinc ribbon domain-containing protein [Verrucomicrobiae bacterium]
MKFCPECGAEAADEAQSCPNDRQPLIALDTPTPRAGSPNGPVAFNAQVFAPARRAGGYRVYVQGNDLFFIRTDGGLARRRWTATLAHLGPLGALLSLLGWLVAQRRSRTSVARLEESDLEALVRQSNAHFKVFLLEIREAVLKPQSVLSTFSSPGEMEIHLRGDETLRFGFDSGDEMKAALFLLLPVLRPVLRVEAEWDAARQRFRRPRTSGRDVARP